MLDKLRAKIEEHRNEIVLGSALVVVSAFAIRWNIRATRDHRTVDMLLSAIDAGYKMEIDWDQKIVHLIEET